MNIKTIAYLGSTIIVSLLMAASCVAYLTGSMNAALAHLGFSPSFALLLGTYKGTVPFALLAPLPAQVRFLREWCYAGLFFTLTGAIYFHLMAGDHLTSAIAPLVIGALTTLSWALRPDSAPKPAPK